MRLLVLPRFLISLALVAGACGGDDDDSSGPPATITQQEFATQYVEALCGGQAECCQKGSHVFESEADCRAQSSDQVKTLGDAAAQSGQAYDAAVAADCIALLQQARTTCQLPLDSELEDRCELVFHGTKAQGGTCDTQDCGRAPDGTLLRCARRAPSSGVASTCQQVSSVEARLGRRGKAGDVCRSTCTLDSDGGSGCDSTDDDIPEEVSSCFTNDGLHCDGQHCVAQLAAGAACTSAEVCGAGLVCSVPDVCSTDDPTCGQPGVCQTPPGVGDACLFESVCAGGAHCDSKTMHCVADKALGEPCDGTFTECASGFCADGVCEDERDRTRPSACAKLDGSSPSGGLAAARGAASTIVVTRWRSECGRSSTR